MQSIFQQWVIGGGVMMIALVPCLILAVAFIVQAALTLRRSRLAPDEFTERLRDLATQQGAQAARDSLGEESSSLAEIVRNVDAELRRNPNIDGIALVQSQIESECDLLLQQNSPLALLVRVAPQLGLLGTLIGLHGAFTLYGSGSPDTKVFAQAIAGALVPTVWGVLVAFGAFLAHYLVQRRIASYEQSIFPTEAASALRALRGES
ncbi:MAG: MotA/TolQ/ExbB proton channel family protein [Candidatus Sumerlaeota bacterium]